MDVLGYLGPCKHTDPPGNWDAYLFVCKLYSLKGEKRLCEPFLRRWGDQSMYMNIFFDKCDHVYMYFYGVNIFYLTLAI